MRQSEQLCERVLPRTNVPSTVQLSKGPASQDIVPPTKNMLPKKHYRGVHGPPSDFNSDGDGDVFPSAVGLPTPSITEGGRSHSDGISMPEWNQAHRAHEQTRRGGSISN